MSSEISYREVTPTERLLLNRLIFLRPLKGDQPAVEVEQYRVRVLDEQGSLKFAHNFDFKQLEQRKFPVEAQVQDVDGIWIHALLFTVGDKVDELEIYKDDGSAIIRMPQPHEWEILEL